MAVTALTKRFGDVVALGQVDLHVQHGDVLVLLGPNGAGKSTLLRILATVVLPDEGVATVAGYDVVRAPGAVRRSVGLMLGDERSWYWRLTGRQNLEFFGILYGLRRGAAVARARELLSEFGLTEAADRPFRGYSSGMRARLSLARALIVEPPVLLLDEPTRNLDPLAAASFRELLVELVDRRGTGVLFATHDLREAADIASHVVALAGGRVAFRRPRGADAFELERAMKATAAS